MIELEVEKRLSDFHLRAAFDAGNEVVALFGPSGTGKSLTLQCIAGLVRPDAGRIAINGQVVFDSARRIDLPPQRRGVGYVFQDYALLPHLSVEDNIAYGLHRLPRERARGRVAEMIALMRLNGVEKHRPTELSGGQQQRVALARALATEPNILLLDEPFSALDSAIRSKLRGELLQTLGPLGITVILVTHNLEEAYSLSQKMVVYEAGQVLQVGSRDEVLHHPRTRAVARFTGAKNIFSGRVVDVGEDHTEIDAGFRVMAPASGFAVGSRVEFCIRPEQVMLLRPGLASDEAVKENQLVGSIVQEVSRGSSHLLLFKLDGLSNGDPYDLHIEVPAHVYRKLDLLNSRCWAVSLKKSAIHVMPLDDIDGQSRSRRGDHPR